MAACGESSFDRLVVEGPTVVNLTARSATIVATTAEDVACAVVFGTTTEFGRIATDLDMAGGGHRDHSPLLTGLQPDTQYHYRLSGVGPDGERITSENLTFRTLAEDPSAQQRPAGDNLALQANGARIASVSSVFGGDASGPWRASHAIDGDPATQWSSAGDGNDAWIEIELAEEARITTIGFWTRTMGATAQITAFLVITDRGESYGPFEVADASIIHFFETDFVARSLRFEAAESSGGNTGAVEIEIYGTPTA